MPSYAESKSMGRKAGTLLSLAVLVAIMAFMPSLSEGRPEKHLLVLHSYHKGYKWTDDVCRGIEAALQSEGRGVRVRHEFMDTKRFSGPEYFQLLYDTYRYKFSKSRFDVVIASDNDAFNFLLAHRDDLFPGTPAVFCGVNYFEPSQLRGAKLFTGVNEAADIKATIDVALKLLPKTRRIVVINDTTTTGLVMHGEIAKLVPVYRGRVTFTFLEEAEMPEVLAAVQKLPADTLVFYTLFLRDKAGRVFEYDEGLSMIAEKCPVPIFGVWDFNLGHGMVGGMLTSGYYQGETAGRMAVRILRGERVENIPPVMKSPNRYMFDYRQLRRFRLALSSLPDGSIAINRPVNLYSMHRGVFWTIVAALAAAALVILFLLRTTAKRKRAEETLRESEGRYRTLFEGANDAIVTIRDGLFVNSNRKAMEMFRCTAAELIGRAPEQFSPSAQPDGRESVEMVGEKIAAALAGRPQLFEWRHRRCDGELFDAEVSLNLVEYQGNVELLAIIRDVTERKEMERLKDEMISAVSHEMRTPLTAMLGFTEFMLQHEVEPQEQKEYLRAVYSETERLSELIGNFLDLQRMKARQMVYRFKAVAVRPLLEEVAALFADAAKKHRITVQAADDLPPVRGDEARLHQVLNNFLSNAVKYSPKGGEIILGARRDGEDVIIRVQDEGIGIAPDLLDKIFERFYQVDSSDRRMTGGAGLGLALVREIVSAHGGRVWAESTEGKGSTFYASLPVVKGER